MRQPSSHTLSGFLAAFFPDEHEPIHLRAFAPKKAPTGDARFTARKIVVMQKALATDEAIQEQLCQLNKTRGLYFVVNAGGDTDEEIVRFNAWFAEDDGRSIDEQHQRLSAAPLLPSIRVETRQSVHAYWLIDGECNAEEWRDIQQRLIAHFGGDEKIKNPLRVMRMPFFNHVHFDEGSGALSFKRVELGEFAPERRYTLAEMQAAFASIDESLSELHSSTSQVEAATFSTWDELNAEAARRIRLSSKARTNNKGWTQAPGICHGSTGGKALYVSPDGAYGCHKGCQTAIIRIVYGLPERPATTESESSLEEASGTANAESTPLKVVQMSGVETEEVSWLWYPYIALGKLTLLEGDPGLGKSWLTCAIAAGVSCGRGLPGAGIYEARNVLMLSAEDGLADTLRPRLNAVSADVSRVFALDEPLTFDLSGLLKLEAAIIKYKPSLITIDPLFAFTGSKTDIHRANECRAISAPLAAIAERQGCAILALRHLGKSRGGGHALNAGIGSIDFTAAARSVLLVGADPDEPNKRAIVQTKNNLASNGPAVGFMLEDSQFYWTGESSLTAGRILSVTSEDERSTLEEAAYFLRRALQDGPLPTKEVKREARKAGISDATLRRAKDRLGIRAEHIGGRFGDGEQRWVWILPGSEGNQENPEDAQEKETEHLVANEPNKNSYDNGLAQGAQLSEFEHLQSKDEHLQETPEETTEREALLDSYAGIDRPVIAGVPQTGGDIPF